MKVGRPKRQAIKNLRALMKDTRATVVCLQEAMTYMTLIRLVFALRWRVYTGRNLAEGENCAVLVRRDPFRRRRDRGTHWGLVRNLRRWKGPKHGWEHPGRVWPWVVVLGIRVMSLHRVTGGPHGPNAAAYKEEASRLREFVQYDGPVFVVGDTNTLPNDKREGSMADIAKDTGATLILPASPRVDYAMGKGVRGTMQKLGTYDSDHPATVTVLRVA